MAFPANAVWEVRSSGNSTANGAAYVPGLGGTDYSQQNTPQLTLSDVVTSNSSAVITSATGGFTSLMVGNGLTLIESGITRWYYVLSRQSTNQVTLDKNVIGGAQTGLALRLGGAATLTNSGVAFVSFIVGGNHIWKNGSFGHSSNAIVYTVSGSATNPITIEGYAVTRGDGGYATMTRTSTNIDVLEISGNFYIVKNLYLDQGNNFNASLKASGFACTFENIKCTGSITSTGTGAVWLVNSGGNNRFYRCIVDGQGNNGKKGSCCLCSGFGTTFDHCEFYYAGEDYGMLFTSNNNTVRNCIIRNNALDGIRVTSTPLSVYNNDISRNGRDGIRIQTTGSLAETPIQRNVFNRDAGYEINYSTSDISANTGAIDAALENVRNNAFYVTGSGQRNNLPAFTNSLTLTGDPFVDSLTNFDFTLNAVAGAGKSVRDNAMSVALPGGTGTDYHPLGALIPAAGNTPPNDPSSLVATVISATRIDLTWADNSNDEIYFILERAVNGGSFASLALILANVVSYSDTTVSANNVYQYRIKAVN